MWSARARTRTPSSSGGCAAAAATSASRRDWSSACTRSSGSSAAGSRTSATDVGETLRGFRDLVARAPARPQLPGGAGDRRVRAADPALASRRATRARTTIPRSCARCARRPGWSTTASTAHSFLDQQHLFDPPYGEDRNYWKGHFVRELPDELIDELRARAWSRSAAAGEVLIESLHGAPETPTRPAPPWLPRRRVQHQRDGELAGPGARRGVIEWARETAAAIEPGR